MFPPLFLFSFPLSCLPSPIQPLLPLSSCFFHISFASSFIAPPIYCVSHPSPLFPTLILPPSGLSSHASSHGFFFPSFLNLSYSCLTHTFSIPFPPPFLIPLLSCTSSLLSSSRLLPHTLSSCISPLTRFLTSISWLSFPIPSLPSLFSSPSPILLPIPLSLCLSCQSHTSPHACLSHPFSSPQGCSKKVLNTVKEFSYEVLGCLLAILLVQVLAMIFSMVLCCTVRRIDHVKA